MVGRDLTAARERAEANLRKKEESQAAARVVMAEVAARKEAELVKTARLRALRLEREATERAVAEQAPRVAKPRAGKRS